MIKKELIEFGFCRFFIKYFAPNFYWDLQLTNHFYLNIAIT